MCIRATSQTSKQWVMILARVKNVGEQKSNETGEGAEVILWSGVSQW